MNLILPWLQPNEMPNNAGFHGRLAESHTAYRLACLKIVDIDLPDLGSHLVDELDVSRP